MSQLCFSCSGDVKEQKNRRSRASAILAMWWLLLLLPILVAIVAPLGRSRAVRDLDVRFALHKNAIWNATWRQAE